MKPPTRLLAVALVAATLLLPGPAEAHAEATRPASVEVSGGPPVLAYYYIWFTGTSWNRAKRDYPLAGRYSSDERTVMQQHVRAAKAAGVTGFLVSWKSTPVLDARLATLVEVSRTEGFRLGIVYQGLDVTREPLPVARVQRDLELFAKKYSGDPVFTVFDQPLVVWAGTWRFTTEEVARVARAVGPRLALLGSEKGTERWPDVGKVLDGNAYYWSSVDPERETKALGKLTRMSRAVHSTGGLWVAPATPGFDARLIGGTRVVERQAGQTLRRTWGTALRSSPDAVGVISWNEFSENTHIEPSRLEGDTALRTLAALTGTPGPTGELDSSAPGGRDAGGPVRAGVVGALLLGLVGAAALRNRRPRTTARHHEETS